MQGCSVLFNIKHAGWMLPARFATHVLVSVGESERLVLLWVFFSSLLPVSFTYDMRQIPLTCTWRRGLSSWTAFTPHLGTRHPELGTCYLSSKSAVPTTTIVPRDWGLVSFSSSSDPLPAAFVARGGGIGFSIHVPYTRPLYAATPV